jgi:hypothetical protein
VNRTSLCINGSCSGDGVNRRRVYNKNHAIRAPSFWQANPLEGWLLCFGGEEEEKRMSDYSPFAGRCIYTVELRVRDLCEPRIFAIRKSRLAARVRGSRLAVRW